MQTSDHNKRDLALVTGASSGIGLAMAKVLAGKKIDLIVVARSQQKLEALKVELEKQFPITVYPITKDLSSHQNALELYQEIKSKGLKVTILINNAGAGAYGSFTEMPVENDTRIIELNITSLVVLTKLFIAEMKINNYGRIMNLASLLSFMSFPYFSVYAATKAFVLSFTEAIAAELEGTNIYITALCPGPTHSNFASSEMEHSNAYRLMKLSSAEEVAKLGIEKMLQGKKVAVVGLQNKFIILMTKLGTRTINLKINKFMGSPGKKSA